MKFSRLSIRTTALALCLALCVSSLFGCSSTSGNQASGSKKTTDKASLLDPKKPTTIVVWTYYNGPQKLAFDNLILEFNETVGKELGIAVDGISHSNVNELINNVLAAVNEEVGASAVPQIFSAYADTAYAVNKLGFVVNLDDYFTPEELATYVPDYIDEGRLDAEGGLRIFPTAKSTELLMLNKTDWDKFSTATGAELSALSTMEGVATTAARYYEWTDSLTPAADDGKAFFGRDAMANYFVAGCQQLGTELLSVQNDAVTVNCNKDTMRRLWNSFYVPFVQGHYTANMRFRSDDAKTGDIIALVCSTSGAAYFPTAINVTDTESYPIESIVLPAPIFEGGKAVAIQQGAGMVVAKSTPAQEYASVVFIKWFTEAERNMRFAVESGYLPVKANANSPELLSTVLAKLEPSPLTESLSRLMPIAVEVIRTHELYTTKAFEHGTQARTVLETHMMDTIKADLTALEERVALGETREQVLAELTADAHFDEWFSQFKQALENAALGTN